MTKGIVVKECLPILTRLCGSLFAPMAASTVVPIAETHSSMSWLQTIIDVSYVPLVK